MALEILYENKDLLAVAKPSGQLVIPGRGTDTGVPLVQELENHLKKKVFVVHRLDRGASGIVLFAKNAQTHRHLCMQFENREVQKVYEVAVLGELAESGRIDTPLKAFGSGRMGIDPAGKPSSTEYVIVEKLKGATLLEVLPHTGRRHQIRVHLYSIGYPVLGDALYGKDRPVGGCARLMLHAAKLGIQYQESPLNLEARRPDDFVGILKAWRGAASAT